MIAPLPMVPPIEVTVGSVENDLFDLEMSRVPRGPLAVLDGVLYSKELSGRVYSSTSSLFGTTKVNDLVVIPVILCDPFTLLFSIIMLLLLTILSSSTIILVFATGIVVLLIGDNV